MTAQLRRRITTKARAAALVAAVLAGMAAPALAWVDVQTGGQDARAPLVAVSDTGNARGDCWDAGQNICFTGQEGVLAASGAGTATGGIAVSATGNATATSPGWGIPAVAVSGTGCATAGNDYGADSYSLSGTGCSTASTDPAGNAMAVSGLGCATATNQPWVVGTGALGVSVGVAPTCGAGGTVAVSGTGNSDSSRDGSLNTLGYPFWQVNSTYRFVTGQADPVFPFNDAPVPSTAVSGTGDAHSRGVAVAGGDASAYGGLLCVSVTGDCRGASVYSVCPMGYCE